jgi:type II secretory pathway pseudopilin PulG
MFLLNGKYDNDKGFSLIEVIISIGIISFAFVGVMAIFASNIRTEIANRDRITASYLAQEGVEVIRQQRDNIWFNGGDLSVSLPTGSNMVLNLKNASQIRAGWQLTSATEANKKIYRNNDGANIQTADGAHPASWDETNFRRSSASQKMLRLSGKDNCDRILRK